MDWGMGRGGRNTNVQFITDGLGCEIRGTGRVKNPCKRIKNN